MPRLAIAATAGLFLLSGFAALVYQVLWVRELGLLFGNTAQAAALAIAIFFAGLAAGGWIWGRIAPRVRSPLKAFGFLEMGVAATALGHFFLLDLYHAIYPTLFTAAHGTDWAVIALRAGLGALVLFPPAFLMGGTLPMMGQHMVRLTGRLSTTGTAVYALNTFGSAMGALAAGFMLPPLLGFNGAYMLAIGIDLGVGLAALALALATVSISARPRDSKEQQRRRRMSAQQTQPRTAPPETRGNGELPGALIILVAFVSGTATLGVEVLWTRLFAQVLQNSVYTYAVVLVAFLLALSLGSLAANALARLRRPAPRHVLLAVLAASALVTAASPWAFHAVTGGLSYVGAGASWLEYLAAVSTVALLIMVLPGILLGVTLPYLLRLSEATSPEPGEILGRLVAVNTSGAIVGSLTAGFVLLPWLGVSGSLLALAGLYPVLMIPLILREPLSLPARLGWAAPVTAAAVTLLFLRIDGPAATQIDSAAGEELIELIEGTHATAAVIERGPHRLIRVNNFYTLGGTGALESERNQTLIPMLTHPEPRRVFYLGMGTGITAGASLLFPVERVDVCELLPEVVELAERHFRPWTQGLFDDDRVNVRAEDGQHCLRHADTEYDLIISDLFTPWKAGSGNLYTVENYRTGRERLAEDGLFVQWLPLYQLTEKELSSIARTMQAVFPRVVMWRGDLFADGSIVALVGTEEGVTVDPEAMVNHGRALADNPALPEDLLRAVGLRFYAGNVGTSDLFADAPLNTRDRPVVEYEAPRSQRRVQAGEDTWMTGSRLGLLYRELLEQTPPAQDPYLASLQPEDHGFVQAGQHYYFHNVLRFNERHDLARAQLQRFLALTPFEEPPPDPDSPETRSRWEEGR
ncbi:fused MFS/spermidine synthase [Aquisalimonas sp. 2447]|uniref:fused MFS/spermidine synthase n=1 Tax=Aquisalimonas sp. 2447 TaxID=2740807 RepID=UPI0014327F2D|nr:fused MFS/spermidine synthase [Aquisalimonas sp. 2447]QIT56206.1 fused MFS/spermidine synthase [Aquisalimonas sp. 2447]